MIHSIQAGDVLAGKYRVERVLGAGGMGMVVAARHLDLNKLVALKFMLSSASKSPEAARRFLQEARSAAQLRSEHVAHVSDYGSLETGEPYIVIEYLEGEDLGHLLKRSGTLGIGFAVELMLQACEAIEEAHAGGIIHRDLKPQNMFLTKRHKGTPCLKVLDFGLSKVALTGEAPAGLHQTTTTQLIGSPLYMSPEQMRSARGVDHRADIWSLGATLYELLTGSPPFPSESLMELCVKLSFERPRPLRELRPEVPAGLEGVVLRCLEADPQARFQSVAELSAALAPFADQVSPTSLPREGAAQEPAPPVSDERFAQASASSDPAGSARLTPSGSASWGGTQGPSVKRSGSLLPWGVVLGLVAVGGAGWLGFGRSAPQAPQLATPLSVATPTPAASTLPEPLAAPPNSAAASGAKPAAVSPKAVAAKQRSTAAAQHPTVTPAVPAAPPAKNDTSQEDPWSRK